MNETKSCHRTHRNASKRTAVGNKFSRIYPVGTESVSQESAGDIIKVFNILGHDVSQYVSSNTGHLYCSDTQNDFSMLFCLNVGSYTEWSNQ